MSFIFTKRKTEWMNGAAQTVDFDTDDMRVLLAMTNTVLDTEEDVDTFDDLTGNAAVGTDEMDGANYTTLGIAFSSEAVNEDLANDRAEFDAEDVTWSALGVGTRDVAGACVYKFVTSLALSLPVAWIDTGGFPFAASGTDFTIQWNSEGIVQFT